MKGAVLAVLCAVALTHGGVVVNQNGCPVDYQVEKLLPHPNCGQYYQCAHGNLIEMSCAPGLHFSAASNACDFPIAAHCQSQSDVHNTPLTIDGAINTEDDDNVVAGHGDPSEAPAICAAAESDGVLVAHENCRRFYKCSFGLPVSMKCPGILLYDFTVERCEWPQTVECGDRVILDDESEENPNGEWSGNGAGNDDPSQAPTICATEGSDHSYVAHEYCDKFYQCWMGHPVALDCPPGFLFNPNKDYCDFPFNVDCGNRGISENQGSGNDNGNGSGNGNTEDEIPVGDNNDDPSQAPTICGNTESDGVLVAHENCNQFYKCAHGVPVAQICPGTLLFDPTKDWCEWPEKVECGNRVIPELNDNDKGDNQWTGNGAGNDDPSQAPAICAAEGSDHSYVAHEYCDKFYQCWAGHPVALDCPPDHLFNPNKDYCDFPYNVDCGNRVISADFGNSNNNQGGSGNGNAEDEIPVGDNHDDPSQAPTICGSEGSDGVLVAHENCNQFYKCAHGLPVAQICPGTLLFDPTKDRCEWPETVECGNRVIPELNDNDKGDNQWTGNGAGNDDPSQAPAICAAEGSDHSYVAHEYCDKFYQCWAGHPVALDCPPDHLFNPNKDYCDFPYNVDCGNRVISADFGNSNNNQGGSGNGNAEDEIPVGDNHDDPSQAPTICGSEGSDGVLVAHENCNQFYKCAYGLPVAQICPGTLLFDPTKDRCEWPETVECGNRVIPELNDNDNKGNEWTGNGAGNDDPSQAPTICAAEGSDHSYIAHEFCNKFYQCWAGHPVALDCPAGYLFNPDKDYCDFPNNVNCGNRLVSVY